MEYIKSTSVKEEIARLRKLYTADIAQGTLNVLVLGGIGTGKTFIAKTCRAPVLIDSFDPGGTKALRDEIEKGRIIVDSRYEKEDASSPSAYIEWEKEFMRRRSSGFFNSIGTYFLDSFTTWIDALKNHQAKRKGRVDGVLQLQDWQVVGNVVKDAVKLATALPCDFVLTGHLFLVKEEVSGRMIARFNSIPSLQIDVPLLFDEIYVMQTEEKSTGVERSLLTAPTGRFEARTRVGAEKFSLYEKPDIKYLAAKAGLPAEDKPLI